VDDLFEVLFVKMDESNVFMAIAGERFEPAFTSSLPPFP
jgi:hypothetical protein